MTEYIALAVCAGGVAGAALAMLAARWFRRATEVRL